MAKIYHDAKWRGLRAVQNRQLFLFPKDIYGWDALTPRWILGALWMTQKTYPEKFAPHECALASMVSDFFRRLYFMNDDAIRNHILPEIAPYHTFEALGGRLD